MYGMRFAATRGITLLPRWPGPRQGLRIVLGDGPMIKSETEFLDTMLEMVKATEMNHEYAVSAVVTMARLIERGYDGLAFEVLETFRPGA